MLDSGSSAQLEDIVASRSLHTAPSERSFQTRAPPSGERANPHLTASVFLAGFFQSALSSSLGGWGLPLSGVRRTEA